MEDSELGIQQKIPDVVVWKRGDFYAVYITSAEFLEQNGPSEIGKPFVGYRGARPPSWLTDFRTTTQTPVLSKGRLEKLLEMLAGDNVKFLTFEEESPLPETVVIGGMPYAREQLAPKHIPYSSEKNAIAEYNASVPIRTKEEYWALMMQLAPEETTEEIEKQRKSDLVATLLSIFQREIKKVIKKAA